MAHRKKDRIEEPVLDVGGSPSLASVHQKLGGEDAETKDRDRVRKIVLSAAQKVVDGIIDTSPDRAVSLDALVGVFRNTIREPVAEFRAGARARFYERLALNQGRLDEADIADLTCEDS